MKFNSVSKPRIAFDMARRKHVLTAEKLSLECGKCNEMIIQEPYFCTDNKTLLHKECALKQHFIKTDELQEHTDIPVRIITKEEYENIINDYD